MAEKKSAVIPWLQPQETEEETPKTSSFGSIFDNISAWGNAAYANTRELGMGRDIKNTFDKLYNRQYSDSDEKAQLIADLDRLQAERDQYRNDFQENQEILNQNDSYLKDFTEIGGTLQGIGTQVRDTAIGAGLGAIGGSVVPVAGTASGAMTGARIGNFVGSIDQAVQDADMNAIDAWERVLQEGGTPDQAEQAYKDAFWANMPTEAMDIISSMYMGGKLLGGTGKILNRALGGKLAGTLASGVNKVARFDLPAKLGTYVANRSGQAWLGQGVGVGLGMLENAVEEGVQEPWQDYETERAIDKQRRIYDPTNQLNKDVRDHSIFGDGGLLDYYTTEEGMNTAIKAAKMGAVFGGAGGLMSKSQYTELGTAHSDNIQSARREADWIDKQGLLKDKGNLERYNNVKETMANIYDLSEDEKADLSVEDVARMYHEYYTNLFGQGGNRQEQNAVSQADFLNEITGEETARRGLMGDTATKYIDEFGIRPDNETLVGINDNQQVLSEEQVQETLEQDEQETTGEAVEGEQKTGIVGKFRKGKINNKTSEQAKEEQAQNSGQVQQKKGGLKEKYGNWERIDEGEGYDYNYRASYRNTKTGRVARIDTVNGGYTITDITDKEEGTPTIAKTLKDVTKFLGKKANQKTRFMSDGTQGQEQVSQALPKEDGVISEINSDKITEDAEKNQWFNGKKIQSNKAQTIHSMQDLHDYYKTHKDLMSKDLYAEISRQMMRFGIGNANNTEIVLDLTNREAGGFGSETTIRTDPNDENSAVAKAIVRLYAGADLATAAHEMAHLGWMNLSDQDRATFTKWAEKTQGEFIAKILGMDYDQNFRSYLIEALTNRESQTSKDLWAKIKREGAVQQTLGILNGQNYGLAVEERFAWEFSNWYAQGYIKGAKPRNIIERILNKACATLQGALNLLSDTNRYLNGENGYNGGDINNIFTNMSTRGIGQQRQTVAPQVELRTEMTQPIQESPYNLGQGVDETFEEGLYINPQQNLSRNTGTIGSQTYTQPKEEQKTEQDINKNSGTTALNKKRINNKKQSQTYDQSVSKGVVQYKEQPYNGTKDLSTQGRVILNNTTAEALASKIMERYKNAPNMVGAALQNVFAHVKNEQDMRFAESVLDKVLKQMNSYYGQAMYYDNGVFYGSGEEESFQEQKEPTPAEGQRQKKTRKKKTEQKPVERIVPEDANQEEEDERIQNAKVETYKDYKDSYIKQLVRGAFAGKSNYKENLENIREKVNPARLEKIINEVIAERNEEKHKGQKNPNKSVENSNLTNENQDGTIEENPTGAVENQTGEVAESGETQNTRGTENLQGNVGEVQGGRGVRTGDDSRTGEGRVGQNSVEERSEGNGKDISLLKNSKFKSVYNERNEKKTEVKDWRDLSDSDEAKQVFVDALNASKEADMQHGVYVDGKTVEELKDCKVILHKNKMAGFAITPDGNIVGVFSNPKNPIRGILNDMIFIAHMMGGNRMDCFGNFLLHGYRACGFTPVARTTFAEEYYPADNPANNTIRKEKPDVFFLVKDNDNNTAYLDKMNKGEYKNDQIEIDNIPLIDSEDSYGDALGFQGQVLKEIQKKENKNKSTKEVADSLRPKEETATENQETTEQTQDNQTESQKETTERISEQEEYDNYTKKETDYYKEKRFEYNGQQYKYDPQHMEYLKIEDGKEDWQLEKVENYSVEYFVLDSMRKMDSPFYKDEAKTLDSVIDSLEQKVWGETNFLNNTKNIKDNKEIQKLTNEKKELQKKIKDTEKTINDLKSKNLNAESVEEQLNEIKEQLKRKEVQISEEVDSRKYFRDNAKKTKRNAPKAIKILKAMYGNKTTNKSQTETPVQNSQVEQPVVTKSEPVETSTKQVQQTSTETKSKEKTTPKKEETLTAEQIIDKANSDKTFRENSAVYVREREDGTVYGQVWTRDENGENLRQIGEITSYDDFERADLKDEEYLAYGEDYSDDIVDGEGIAEAMFEDAGNNEAATAKQVLEKQIEKETNKDKRAFYRHVIKKIGSYIADRGHISDDESEGIKSLFDDKEDVDIYNDEEGFIKEVDSVYKKYAKIKQEEKDAKKRAKERDKLLDKWQEQTREREYDEIDKGINEVAEDIKKNADSYADDFYQAFRNYLDSDYDSNVRIGNGDIQEKKNSKWTHIRDLTKSEKDLVKRIDDLVDSAQMYDDLLDKFATIVPEREQTSPETKTTTEAKTKTKKTTQAVNEGNIENNTKTQPLTQQQNQTTIDKSDKNYQRAVELVIKNRGMSATGLRLTLKDEGIVVGQEKAEQYLVQMENDGIVEHGDEGSLRLLKKNPSTKMQEAGQNAENQTLLTPQVEEELENLFWKLIRKKQFHGMDSRWESGKLDYYKSLSNRRQGKEFNPEFIKGDKAFLNAIKNVNDYIHEKFPQYKNVYRGVDGHWRFEFSDKDAHFINGFEKLSGKTLDTTLEKILKHDNLYKFYSKLKGMPVHLVRNTKMQELMEDTENQYYAMYDPDERAIYINSDMFESGDEVRNSLLHEIQHAIQDIEGFANGTNDNAYNNDYDFSEGEKQAVLTEKRSNMSDKELQQNPRSKTLNPNEKTIIQEQRPVKKVAKTERINKDGNVTVQAIKEAIDRDKSIDEQIELLDKVSKNLDFSMLVGNNEKRSLNKYISNKDIDTIRDSLISFAMDNPSRIITKKNVERLKQICEEEMRRYKQIYMTQTGIHQEVALEEYKKYNNELQATKSLLNNMPENGQIRLLTIGEQKENNVIDITNRGRKTTTPSTKMQSNGQNNLGYIDKQKDIYSVTFTKSAQQNAENKKKIDFYRKNKSYWRENKDAQTGSITFTRALPYQQHQKTIIYDEINGKKVGKRKKAKWREYYEAFKDHMIKWLFNDKHFLEKAARNVGAIESYMRMMVMKDQGAVAGAAIEDGIVKHNGKNGERTKSLNSIIEAVGEENQTDFLNYCEAYRVLDLEKRNIYQKMTPDKARKEIAKVQRSKNAKLFEEQRKNFVEYNHELLWVLVDGGFITEKQYDNFIKIDPNFIPLAKNMDELEGYVDGFKDSKTMINVAHPMHKIGTSMREVANPFLEMQKRTVEYYVKASRNKAGHIFVHDIAEAIAQNAKGDVVAQNQGMVRKLASRDKNGKPISHDNKQYVFYVWENGEKQYYQVADREIYVALKSFDAEQMGALSKIMNATAGKASRLVRNTATMTPDFGLRNLVRDNMEAFISSEHGFLPLVDSLWGMYQMANDTQWFKEYQRMNGEHLSLNRDGEDVATVEHDIKDNVKFYKTIVPLFKKDLHEFMDKDRSMPARAKSLLKLVALDIVPLQSIYKANKRLNDYLETGTRIGEYRNARMGYKGLKGRLFETSGSTIWTTDMDLSRAKNTEMIAAYKSKDITLNFGQHGVLGKELNRYIPFFNASLQGIYKLGNTLDDMIHAEDARRRQELMFKCALMGAMGMAAALAGQGDDDYDEAPDYEHENFWILPNGIRIPKDQLFGKLIGGTVEKATAQYLKDGDVKKLELVQDVLGNFAIDKCVPALVDLGWGTIGNYDSFKKKSVTPEYMADKLGYLQKDLSTSKAGADISKAIFDFTKGVFGTPVDVGAKKVDFVISKTLSNLGKYATSLWELTGGNEKMTRGAEVEDKGGFAETSKELPYPMNQIVGTFATNRNSFQSISDFYERHRELKKLSSDESIMSKNEKKAWEAYQAAYKKDKQYRDALKAIKLDKSLTGAQKRQKADKIFKQQISMARKLHDWEKKHGLV